MCEWLLQLNDEFPSNVLNTSHTINLTEPCVYLFKNSLDYRLTQFLWIHDRHMTFWSDLRWLFSAVLTWYQCCFLYKQCNVMQWLLSNSKVTIYVQLFTQWSQQQCVWINFHCFATKHVFYYIAQEFFSHLDTNTTKTVCRTVHTLFTTRFVDFVFYFHWIKAAVQRKTKSKKKMHTE